ENEVDRKDGEIVFKIDSKIAYYGKTQVNLDTAPTILENFTVVPLRALGDALGAETQYEDATRTVTVKYQDKEIVFYIDSKLVKVNNEWKVIDIAATLINNRVMIPARFVSESFGAAVVWDAETREVIITK
ncbi:MAG: stalk domain-containing protein, partial [Peptococcia bacterium]